MRLPGSLATRGLRGALCRAAAIACRHGFAPDRMLHQVSEFTRVALAYGMRPTFPIIASRSATCSPTLAMLQDAGALFASHGLRHVDYTLLDRSDQAAEIGKAMDALAKGGIRVTGFRAPYLRTNDDLREVVAEQGFSFDSSEGLLWPLAEEYADHRSAKAVADFYGAPEVEGAAPLPTDGQVVRIPVSLPDDEICVERLGLRPETVARQWCRNLTDAFDRGGAYVLQLHPERFGLLRDAAEELMDFARSLSPRLWLTTPAEIAEWWRKREQATVRLGRAEGQWVARVEGTGEACLEVVASGGGLSAAPQRLAAVRELVIGSSDRATAGSPPRAAPEIARRLRQGGVRCEPGARPGAWVCHLGLGAETTGISGTDGPEAVPQHTSGTVVRLSRWPTECQAAFCLTGDIDALCLPDFLSRLRG